MRYPPASSVTASKLFPLASCTAVTTTPGSTPPVVSVMTPEIVASCAWTSAGSRKITTARTSRLKTVELTICCLLNPGKDVRTPPRDTPPRVRIRASLSPVQGRSTKAARRNLRPKTGSKGAANVKKRCDFRIVFAFSRTIVRWKRFDESWTLTTLQESADDRAPFLIETAVRDRFAGLPIPVYRRSGRLLRGGADRHTPTIHPARRCPARFRARDPSCRAVRARAPRAAGRCRPAAPPIAGTLRIRRDPRP